MMIFGPDQLDAMVKTIPSDLPDGHTNAIVGGVDQNGVQVVAGFKKDVGSSTWQAQGAFEHTWAGDNQVGARLIVSW